MTVKSGVGCEQGFKSVFEVPLHLTGFFFPVYREREELTGSLGAGLVIWPGIKCALRRGTGLRFNESEIISGPARELYEGLRGRFSVSLSGECAPGAGYAFSASSTLAVAVCHAIAHNLGLSEAAVKAHVAEVRHRTGLGDVLSIWDGFGLAVRMKPGAPGIGQVDSLKLDDRITILTSEVGRLSTKDLLSEYHEKIVKEGKTAYEQFLKEPSLELFLSLSNRFSRVLGLVDDKIEEVVRPFSRSVLGWYVKKRVLVLVAERDEASEIVKNIRAALPVVRVFRTGENAWKRYLQTIPGMPHS